MKGRKGELSNPLVYFLHNLIYEHTNTYRIFQTTLDGNILPLQPVYFTMWLLPFKQSPTVSVIKTGLFTFLICCLETHAISEHTAKLLIRKQTVCVEAPEVQISPQLQRACSAHSPHQVLWAH